MGRPFGNFAKGSFYLLLQNVINLGIGALFWIILAKMIEPQSLGLAMVSTSLALSIVGFTGLGINITISRFIAEYNAKGEHRYIRGIFTKGLMFGIATSIISTIVLASLSGFIATSIYNNPSLTLLFIIISLYIPSQTLLAVGRGVYEGNQVMKYSFYVDLMYQIIRIASAILLVMIGFEEVGIVLAFVIASSILAVVSYLYIIPNILPKSDTKDDTISIRTIARFSSMNFLDIGIRTLSTQIGIIFLGTQNLEWAAFYGIAVLIGNVIGGIFQAISRALIPTASEEYVRNKSSYTRLLNIPLRFALIIVGFVLTIVLLEPSYVLRTIGQDYTTSSFALRIISISSILGAIPMIINSMFNAAGRVDIIGRVGPISYTTAIALTFILVTFYALDGAAIAMLIGSVIAVILSTRLAYKEEKIIISIRVISKPILSILTTLIIGYLLQIFLDVGVYILLVIIMIYIASLIGYNTVNKREIREIIRSLRGKNEERDN